MNRKMVYAFIITTFFVWILFDVWLGDRGGPTESQVIRDWAKYSAFWPHLMGFLCGHWFFPRRNVKYSAWIYGVAIWVALILFDVIWHHVTVSNPYPWFRYSGIWFLTGIPSGMYLWGQPNSDSPVE